MTSEKTRKEIERETSDLHFKMLETVYHNFKKDLKRRLDENDGVLITTDPSARIGIRGELSRDDAAIYTSAAQAGMLCGDWSKRWPNVWLQRTLTIYARELLGSGAHCVVKMIMDGNFHWIVKFEPDDFDPSEYYSTSGGKSYSEEKTSTFERYKK